MNLLSDSTRSLFLRYLIPSISATLVTSIYILADTILIGKGVGPEGIAALNIILPLYNLFFGTGLLFGVGGAVLMSISFGQNDIEEGRNYFTTSVYSVAIISILFWLILGSNFDPIVYFLGATENTIHLVREYGVILIAGAPIFMFSSLLQAFIRNDKAPNLAMAGVITGGITNVVLDYIFIFPMNMGIRGAMIATILGTTLTVIILLSHFFSKNNNLKITKHGFTIKRFCKITGNGFASFLVEISSGIIVFLFNIQLIKYVGDIGITIYGIISNSALVAMSLANGIAQAAQPIIATNYGAIRKDRVHSVSRGAVMLSACLGIILLLIGELFPNIITAAFVDPTDSILKLASPAIRIYFISFAAMTINIFYSNYFQATMKSGFSIVISLLRGLLLGSVFVIILPKFFGVSGIWMVMPVVEFLTLLVALALKWKTNKDVILN